MTESSGLPATAPAPGAPAVADLREQSREAWFSDLQLYGLLAAILVVGVVFQFTTNGLFLSAFNLSNLGRQMAILGVAAAGVTVVIIMGEFDLSIGGATALISTVVGSLVIVNQVPGYIAMPVALGVGLGLGVLQGLLVTRLTRIGFRVASFIVTLAGALAYPALGLLVLPQAAAPLPEWFSQVGTASVPPAVGVPVVVLAGGLALFAMVRDVRRGRRTLRSIAPPIVGIAVILPPIVGMTSAVGFPVLLLICLVWVVIVEIVTQETVFGRHLYAIGGNRQNARLTGVNITSTAKLGFLIMGFVYFLTGVLTLARLNAASPLIGQTTALQAIAAAAIGGVSLVGGRGRPYQALLGVVVIVGLANGFNLMNIPSLWQNVVTGVVLVGAVWFDVSVRNRANQIVHV